jgi:hypothetical protein
MRAITLADVGGIDLRIDCEFGAPAWLDIVEGGDGDL